MESYLIVVDYYFSRGTSVHNLKVGVVGPKVTTSYSHIFEVFFLKSRSICSRKRTYRTVRINSLTLHKDEKKPTNRDLDLSFLSFPSQSLSVINPLPQPSLMKRK